MPLTIYRRHSADCRYRANPVSQRCDCRIWIRGSLPDGKPVREAIKTRSWEQAEKMKDKMEAGEVRAAAGPTTVEDAVSLFLADIAQRGWQQDTQRKFRFLLETRLLPYCAKAGILYLKDFTLEDLTRWRAGWTWAPTTANKMIERLRMFCEFAVERAWMPVNLARKIRVRVDVEEKEPFTPQEMAILLEAAPPELRAMILFMRHSGFRISDTVKLRRADIVRASDGDGWGVLAVQQKVGRSVYVPLPDEVVAALHALPDKRGEGFFWTGRRALTGACDNWRKKFRRLFRGVAVAGHRWTHPPHPHRFRHTFAAEMLLAGVPLEIVSLLLGHSSVKITEKHYRKFNQARQRQVEQYVRATWARPKLKVVVGGKK